MLSPLSLPLNSLPASPKAIAKGFLVLLHIGIWSPSTIYRHLNLLPSPSPFPLLQHAHSFAGEVWTQLASPPFQPTFSVVRKDICSIPSPTTNYPPNQVHTLLGVSCSLKMQIFFWAHHIDWCFLCLCPNRTQSLIFALHLFFILKVSETISWTFIRNFDRNY
jgi:hypothetical protein